MNSSAGFKLNPSIFTPDMITYDGGLGQSVSMEEYLMRALQRAAEIGDSSTTDEVFTRNKRALESKFSALLQEEYDEEFVEPRHECIELAKERVLHTSNELGFKMLMPNFVVPDGEGGVRIEWVHGNKHLRFVCSEVETYLYLEQPGQSQVIRDTSSAKLTSSIDWLIQ